MKWTFAQIEGPSAERKTLELDGYNAPFGRPRKDPILREVIRSRIQTTRYPGSNKQTRHAFGTNYEATEMRGRWMTKNLLADSKTANDMADDWTSFVKDERTCRIAWGFIISYQGYISELELARESEDEIAWKMKIEIDQRDDNTKRTIEGFTQAASDDLVFVQTWLDTAIKLKAPTLPDINPDFLDSLNNLAAELNKPAAELNKLAGRFDDIEKGTFGAIQHFRGAITGLRTGLVSLRDTIVNAGVDDAIFVRNAESDIAWVKYQASVDTQTSLVLDQLNKMDRKAELAQKTEATKFITARDGDTWESLSTRATGGTDKAGDIRALNGARYGTQPQPGESYLVQ